jgi:calcium-dependent protein kinase
MNATMAAFLSFHQSTLLRRAVLTALAMQMSGQQLAGLREQFLRLDRDKNGRISKEELAVAINFGEGAAGVPFSSAGFAEKTGEWFERIFDSVDTDGSKEIEYTEFLAAALEDSMFITEEATRAAFRVFDVDGSGKISQKEFARVVPSDIARLLPEFDLNCDGELDFEEFETMIREAPMTATWTATCRTCMGVESGSTACGTASSSSRGTRSRSPKEWWTAAKALFGA